MGAHHKDSRLDGKTVEARFKESFIKLVELNNECHVWVNYWSFFFHVIISIDVCHFLFKDQIC